MGKPVGCCGEVEIELDLETLDHSPEVQSLRGSVQWLLRPRTCSNPGERKSSLVVLLSTAGQSGWACSGTGRSPLCTY